MNFTKIESSGYKPLIKDWNELSPTNFVKFLSVSRKAECQVVLNAFNKLSKVKFDYSAPLQMYLKLKVFPKQVLLCKQLSDLHDQLVHLYHATSDKRTIPASFVYVDYQVKKLFSK